jgi:hypothetical protein
MSITSTHFDDMQAPCGQRVDGERLRERDDDCLISDDMFYACGCKTIRHEYHDGSVSRTVVRHDGTVVVDELFAER